MVSKFDRDKFLVNQRRLSFKEKYYVYAEDGRELFYVERPFRLWGRRNITVFDDDSRQSPILSIEQDHFWEVLQRNYTVADSLGQTIAKLSRDNISSLFRRGWRIVRPDGNPIAQVREDSILLGILRRVVGYFIGPFIKTDFHFLMRDAFGNERKIGAFTRRMSIFDKYVLDMSEDTGRQLDRRVAVAVGILLDTAERR